MVIDGVWLHAVAPDLAARSPYLEQRAEEWHAFFFVLGIPLGTFVSTQATKRLSPRIVRQEWAARFGPSSATRLLWSFIGGFLLLFGAPFGGDCASGHMISGVSQLAISSLEFSAALFVSANATARWLYRDQGGRS